jgi:hypothetical protein
LVWTSRRSASIKVIAALLIGTAVVTAVIMSTMVADQHAPATYQRR